MIKAIVAISANWCIGKDNDLLFKLPNDMRAFRQATLGKIVICGRKTLESFPGSKPLSGRSTICLCSKENNRDDCFCINDINELKKLLKELAKTQDVFIIGGGRLYHELLDCYDEVIVTKVQAEANGTVFFPNLDENPKFYLEYMSKGIPDGEYITNICTYKRKYL
jgi:dihydrofolate reductase